MMTGSTGLVPAKLPGALSTSVLLPHKGGCGTRRPLERLEPLLGSAGSKTRPPHRRETASELSACLPAPALLQASHNGVLPRYSAEVHAVLCQMGWCAGAQKGGPYSGQPLGQPWA